MLGRWTTFAEGLHYVADREESDEHAKAHLLTKIKWGEVPARAEFASFSGIYAGMLREFAVGDAAETFAVEFFSIPPRVLDLNIPIDWDAGFMAATRIYEHGNSVLYSRLYLSGLHLGVPEIVAIWGQRPVIERSRAAAGPTSDETTLDQQRVQPVRPPTVRRFLEEYADGERTESECREAAEAHFGTQLPEKNVWREAWRALSPEKKRPRGAPPVKQLANPATNTAK